MAGRPRVVVMGVSGCGKSTLGQALAAQLGLRYAEGDDLHPPRNVALMAAGTPLTDEDRQGWLQAVARELASDDGVVVSCSALKRSYRDLLRASAPALRLVHLSGPAAVLEQRLQARSGHYMPASLLPSQLQALEPPGDDENPIVLDITQPPDQLLNQAVLRLRTEP
jgi:gluconokinase